MYQWSLLTVFNGVHSEHCNTMYICMPVVHCQHSSVAHVQCHVNLYNPVLNITIVNTMYIPVVLPSYMYIDTTLSLTVFGSEKRSAQMPIQISTLVPAHNSLWVGTENGVLLIYPFTAPTLVAEESGWEFIKVRLASHVLL